MEVKFDINNVPPDVRELIVAKLKADVALAQAEAGKAEEELFEYQTQVQFARNSNFRNRVHDFIGQVNEHSVHEAIETISRWARQSKDPITVRVTSGGGDVTHGFALFDNIRMHISDGIPIEVVALGTAGSMAAILLQAGTRRVIAQNATFFIHDISANYEKVHMDVNVAEEHTKTMRDINNRTLEILAERSKLSPREIGRRMRGKGWNLNAATAIKYGFADEILKTSYKVK